MKLHPIPPRRCDILGRGAPSSEAAESPSVKRGLSRNDPHPGHVIGLKWRYESLRRAINSRQDHAGEVDGMDALVRTAQEHDVLVVVHSQRQTKHVAVHGCQPVVDHVLSRCVQVSKLFVNDNGNKTRTITSQESFPLEGIPAGDCVTRVKFCGPAIKPVTPCSSRLNVTGTLS